MTDAELRDEAVAFLRKTTDSYPQYVRKGKPAGSYWTKAMEALAQIGAPTPTPVPSPPPSSSGNPVPAPALGVWLGAYLDHSTFDHYYPAEAPWIGGPDYVTWDRFERDAGRKLDYLMFGQPEFFSRTFDYEGDIAKCVGRGAGGIPVIDCDTSQTGGLEVIAAGGHDSDLIHCAQGAAAFGHPLILRPDCEMNGTWYAYANEERANPGIFVKAWVHIVDVFRAQGAHNVSWHWCPNVDPEGRYTPLAQVMPPETHFDWAGMTGYRHDSSEAVEWIYGSTYAAIAKLTSKPMMIGEMASVDVSPAEGNKVEFIQTFFASLAKWPQIRAITWFNWLITENGKVWDWPIESSPAALAAFKTAAATLPVGK